MPSVDGWSLPPVVHSVAHALASFAAVRRQVAATAGTLFLGFASVPRSSLSARQAFAAYPHMESQAAGVLFAAAVAALRVFAAVVAQLAGYCTVFRLAAVAELGFHILPRPL